MRQPSQRLKPVNSQDVRRANRNRIYRFIHSHPGTSRPELVQRMEMSLPTVMQNVKSLFEQGLVKEDGSLESTGGRKAVALTCVRDARLSVGVEITRNHVGVVVVNMEGAVLAGARHRIPFSPDAAYAKRVGRAVEKLVASSGADPASILGAGVSLPGILSADGSVFNTSVLPAVEYATRTIGDALPYPAVYLNDANAAGIAEMWDASPGKSFVYLSLSNSVGGAIIWNSRLHPGDNQRGGEFGHITVQPDGRRCYCGQVGCLDAYCAAFLLSDRADGSLDEFFRLVDDGDRKLGAAWDEYMTYLARAVNILRMAFDCEVVVGGYVGAYMERHIEDLRRRVSVLNTFERYGDYVKVCRRRTEASAVGAALVHIERFIQDI